MARIRDVASRADVSIATVSRVLNGNPRVSEETRRRVWDAARELDFWPNGAARSLITSRTNVLGVLLPDIYGEFYSEIIRGLDHAARSAHYQILISSSHAQAEEFISAALSMHGRIDGLVVMAPDHGSAEAIGRVRKRFPLVLLNPRRQTGGCSSFSIANFDGALEVTEYLIGLGHREIAILTGPRDNADSEGRLGGYRQALASHGLEPRPDLELAGDFTEASGFAVAHDLLARASRPTAIFAANDAMAVGLLSAFSQAGVKVPEEISVAGFDDIATAQYSNPPLTTVQVDVYGLGRQAVDALVAELQTPEAFAHRHEVLPTTLVVRRSCGPAQARPSRSQRETKKNMEKRRRQPQ